MTGDAMAARLYPTTAVPEQAADETQHVDEGQVQEQATAPSSAVPAHIKEMREADRDRRLFSADKAFATTLPDAVLHEAGLDAAESREVLADLGAEHDDVSQLRALMKVQADESTRKGWRGEAQAVIASQGYTAHDLAAARALVARDPRVAEYLDRTGLGDNPHVVRRVIELARSQLAAGRLKLK